MIARSSWPPRGWSTARPAAAREEAEGHFGWMAPFALLDSPASSALTQKWFGWLPGHPGLIADLDEDHYFTR